MERPPVPCRVHLRKFITNMQKLGNTCVRDLNVPLNVHIEGNIAAGKSSFIKHFENKPSLITLPEPLLRWQNFKGHNLLKMKYESNKEFEYLFQSYVNVTRIEQINNVFDKPGIRIMERSLQSSFHVFIQNSHEKEEMDELTYDVLKYMYDVFTTGAMKIMTTPDLIVYIRTSPETCLNRLRMRGREGEQELGLEFLQQLHERHEKWLNTEDAEKDVKCQIMIIDGEQTHEKIEAEAVKAMKEMSKLAAERKVLEHLAELWTGLSKQEEVHNCN